MIIVPCFSENATCPHVASSTSRNTPSRILEDDPIHPVILKQKHVSMWLMDDRVLHT